MSPQIKSLEHLQSTVKNSTIRMSVLLALASGLSGAASAASTVYTLNNDFNLGTLSGVNFTTVANQLQLNTVGTTFPVLWVANAGEDTLSKIDTNTGKELARYRTWFGPSGQPGYAPHLNNPWGGAAPSRSAVDINGHAYILNRHFDGRPAVLIKVLAEGYVDRNANGSMDTSSDADNNGTIGASEIMNLADSNGNGIIDASEIKDERIAWAVRVGANDGVGRALCIGTDGNLWVGLYNARQFYKVSSANGSILSGPHPVGWTPYGCLVDGNGILWSASLGTQIGRLDTNNPASTAVFTDGQSSNYGIALGNGKVYLSSQNSWGFREFNPATNSFSTPNGSKNFTSYGIGVDGAGNIWASIASPGGMRKYDAAGNQLCTGATQSSAETRGMIVDADNNVWQINRTTNSVSKYKGTDCSPLGVFPVGNMPYTYSDATGFAARNITTPTGTWNVVKDAGVTGQVWNNVAWTQSAPAGATVQVSVRADDNAANLQNKAYQPVSNGSNPGVSGRFMQVEVRLTANTGNESPVLFDLTLQTLDAKCDIDLDGDIDRNDISLIQAAIGTTPVANDPRDSTGDGKITINDARACVLRCTRTNCAP